MSSVVVRMGACFGAWVVVGAAGANGIAVPDVALSTTSPAALGGVNFEDDALVGYDPTTDVAVPLFDLSDEFGIMRDLDAAHELTNGNLVVSTQAGATFNTLDFTESDLIELDRVNGTVSMFLDASAIGLVGNNNTVPNINAVHVRDNGNVLFSTASNDGVTLLGESYDKADVIEYDPVNNTASLFFDGDLIEGDDPDLQAFAEIDATHVLLAAFSGTDAMTLGGQAFTRDDLVLYSFPVVVVGTGDAAVAGVGSLFLEGVNEFSAPGEIIDAVTPAVVPEPASVALLACCGVVALRRRGI